ncbi:MAG TPA: DUF4082 domain-containing protein [Bryobacteraceae bacterium]|nr:DUF4082 domain-containing protein [Bryobacteraceae bacterium]
MKRYQVAAALVLISTSLSFGQTLWTASQVPATKQVTNDTVSVTLGLKFYSDVAGRVTGVRFYKGSRNTGTHVGTLWTASGTKLASATFSGETSSGWQQVNFSSSVNIAANTTYVISYLAPLGSYACDQNYAWSTVNPTPLHVAGSSPGVFAYGATTKVPNGTWNQSNYWVDVVFSPNTSTPPATYTISGGISGAPATLTLSGAASQTVTTDAAGKYSFSGLSNGSYVVAPGQSGFTFTPATALVSINGASVSNVTFVAAATPQPIPHSVSLSWTSSTSSNVKGYNVYRADVAGGAYAKLNTQPVAGNAFADGSVSSGRVYYYVATTIDSNDKESEYSNLATAVVPTP